MDNIGERGVDTHRRRGYWHTCEEGGKLIHTEERVLIHTRGGVLIHTAVGTSL